MGLALRERKSLIATATERTTTRPIFVGQLRRRTLLIVYFMAVRRAASLAA